MNDSFFIDTNILVYCYTEDETAKKQIALEIVNHSDAFISTQVLTELANTLQRKFKLDWRIVENVITEVGSGFNVYVNKPGTIEQACRIAAKYHYSYYDSLIIAAELSANCKTLYSEDMQGGQVVENSLTIVNPLK